ncbi:MAG: RNA 2',3'-cyclic phosphodiesterase, partial [Acidimicrobiia bacterium]
LKSAWPQARWTAPADQHLTLKFLGATPEESLDDLLRTGAMVARGQSGAAVSLSTLGVFPSTRKARVLWLGVDDPAGVLGALAQGLSHALEPLGFPAEGRSFTPHLTLARFKSPVRLSSDCTLDTGSLGPFEVSELGLWRSHLSPKGARYELLDSLPLRRMAPGRR